MAEAAAAAASSTVGCDWGCGCGCWGALLADMFFTNLIHM